MQDFLLFTAIYAGCLLVGLGFCWMSVRMDARAQYGWREILSTSVGLLLVICGPFVAFAVVHY